MTTEKPKIKPKRVYLTAKDAHTGKSKTITLYQTTPEKVLAEIRRLARQPNPASAA